MKSLGKLIKSSRMFKKTKFNYPRFPMWNLFFKTIVNVFFELYIDLKKHKMTSLALLDKIEEDIETKFDKLDKSNKSISEFYAKINELENYKYLLFKAREVFHYQRSEGKDPEL